MFPKIHAMHTLTLAPAFFYSNINVSIIRQIPYAKSKLFFKQLQSQVTVG